jgi:hypothetical protein
MYRSALQMGVNLVVGMLVTDFAEYGVHRNAIAAAIAEGEALGLFRVTRRGRAGNAEWRIPIECR